jgi:hypothetical protein
MRPFLLTAWTAAVVACAPAPSVDHPPQAVDTPDEDAPTTDPVVDDPGAEPRPSTPTPALDGADPATLDHDRLFTCVPDDQTFTPPRLWRLDAAQFVELLRAPGNNSFSHVNPFSGADAGTHFPNYAGAFGISEPELAAALEAGKTAARATLRDNKAPRCARSAWADARDNGDPLDGYGEFDDDCRRSFAGYVFVRSTGRELTDDDRTVWSARFEDLVAEFGLERGMELGYATMIANPELLFRQEIGEPVPGSDGLLQLTAGELGAAISWFLADAPPHRARAYGPVEDGSVLTPEGARAMVDTLYDHGEPIRPLTRFLETYFRTARGRSILKSHRQGFSHGGDLLALEDWLETLVEADTRFVERLLSDPIPDEPGHHGILHHPAWLVAFSEPEENHPILRGHFIREHLLCQAIPDVPIDVVPILPPRDPETTTLRDNLAVHSQGTCYSCHQLMDPLGLPLEQFDHYGDWRDEEAGRPVDTTGTFFGAGDLDGPIADADDLATSLSTSTRVEQCFVRHLFRYAVGRDETYGDACTLAAMHDAYATSDGSLREAITALVSSPTFSHRQVAAPEED